MVAYTQNTPNANDTVAKTQPIIKNNFNFIQSWAKVDHIMTESDSTSGTNGFHNKVTFLANQAAPGIAGAVGCLYTGADLYGVTSLAFQNSSGSYLVTGRNPSPAVNGYTCLPGGIILQWGTVFTTSSGATQPFVIPFNTTRFNVQMTPVTPNASSTDAKSISYIVIPSLPVSPGDLAGFTWTVNSNGGGSGSPRGFSWIAIGN